MLLVRLSPPSSAASAPPLPTLPELDDPAFVYIDIARDLPYDYTSLLENVLDVSHVPYTHHATVSNRANGGPVELELLGGVRPGGFDGIWREGPRKGKLGPQSTSFRAPQLMVHSLQAASLGTTLTVVYATPTAPGRSRLLARFPFKFNSPIPGFVISRTPRWLQHQRQNGVLEDDVVFLPAAEAALARAQAAGATFAQACYLPLAQDAYVLAFRRWLGDIAGGGPWSPAELAAAPRAETRDALLDRYQSHTAHCVSCLGALQGVRTARSVLAALAGGAAVVLAAALATAARGGGGLAAAAAALAVVALALWARAFAGTLEQRFFVGDRIPKRNLIQPGRKSSAVRARAPPPAPSHAARPSEHRGQGEARVGYYGTATSRAQRVEAWARQRTWSESDLYEGK